MIKNIEHSKVQNVTSGPWAEINLSAVCANYETLSGLATTAETAAVVKCNGYGLGQAAIAATIAEHTACQTYFVAYPEEGTALRAILDKIALNAAIYVFSGPTTNDLSLFEAAQLRPVINDVNQASVWAKQRPTSPCAIHIETGMNRLGVPEYSLPQIAQLGLAVDLVIGHLACGADPAHPKNAEQRTQFIDLARFFPNAPQSLAASAGVLMDPSFHFDLTRPGIALYGASPFFTDDPRIKSVASLYAPVIGIYELAPGESVGYNALFEAHRRSKIAVCSIGYGDGVPTTASGRGAAFIGGAMAPFAGRVSMDLICLDITDCPQPVEIRDFAEFYGPNLAISDAAAAYQLTAYELLTGLGGRVDRRYL